MSKQELLPGTKRPRPELALEILKRWRNDPGSRKWTRLLERAAWLLEGAGTITDADALAELDNVTLCELFEIEKNGGRLPRFPAGMR